MSLDKSHNQTKKKSSSGIFHESKARSISLDNIDQYNTWPSASPKVQRQHTHLLSTSPSSIFKFKGLKKKLHAFKLSKSNSDITAQNAADGNKIQPSYSGSNLNDSECSADVKKTHSKDEMRKKSRPGENNNISNSVSLYDQLKEQSDRTDLSAGHNWHTSTSRVSSSTDSNDPFIVVESFMNDDSYEDTASQYETDEVDGGCPSEEYTAQEIERLLKKVERTREELIRMQATKDENVKEYLKTVDNVSESAVNQKSKMNFEKNNLKTNSSIQILQKKLEKYQQQLKALEERGIHGPRRIIRVVQDSVRSGASSITGAVSKPLESINQFMKKEKKNSSFENVPYTNTHTDDETERHFFNNNANTSDDENNSSSSSNQQITALATDYVKTNDRLYTKQQERIDKLEKENEEFRESISSLKDGLETVMSSLQNEKYKTDQLRSQMDDMYNQWNDLTELHQNEMMGLKQEMDRTAEHIERIDYRFAERAGEIEEDVESCVTRITKMELEQHQNQQHSVSVDNYFDGNAKQLLSKLLSLVISIFAILLVITSSFLKVILPFASTRSRIITVIVTISTIIILRRNSNHVIVQTVLYYANKLFEPIYDRLSTRTNEAGIDTTIEFKDGAFTKDR